MQFKAQEPGTDDEVLQFCQLNYGVTFPIAKKVYISKFYADSGCDGKYVLIYFSP